MLAYSQLIRNASIFHFPSEKRSTERLQWKLLLEPSIPGLATSNTYARAFQLLMERKRLSTWGITSYELHKKSGRIIFPAATSLFTCLDTGYQVRNFIRSKVQRDRQQQQQIWRNHQINFFLISKFLAIHPIISVRIGAIARSTRSTSMPRQLGTSCVHPER